MTDTMANPGQAGPGFEDPLVVVSSDCHVSPSLEILRQYCPKASLGDFEAWMESTREIREISQRRFVFEGDDDDADIGKIHTWNLQTNGAWDIDERLRDLNQDGVAAEVIFHGSAPFEPVPFMATSIGGAIEQPELAAVGQHMYNRWLADFCAKEPERHVGLAYLPMWDIEESIKELEWAKSVGLRGVNFPQVRAEITPYEDEAWERFWSACEDLEMPLANHGGGGASTPMTTGPMALHIYSAESNALSRISPVVRFVFGGIFERHPELKLIQTEQVGAWYAQVLDELDSRWIAFRHQIGDLVPKLPSEYCRRELLRGGEFPVPPRGGDGHPARLRGKHALGFGLSPSGGHVPLPREGGPDAHDASGPAQYVLRPPRCPGARHVGRERAARVRTRRRQAQGRGRSNQRADARGALTPDRRAPGPLGSRLPERRLLLLISAGPVAFRSADAGPGPPLGYPRDRAARSPTPRVRRGRPAFSALGTSPLMPDRGSRLCVAPGTQRCGFRGCMMMAMGTTVAGFELTVGDLERAESFYVTGLGLEVRAREDHGLFREVQLVGEGDRAALLLVSPRGAGGLTNISSDLNKIVLSVDDVPGCYARAVEAGAGEDQSPQHHADSNVWFARLRDPDGHIVLLVQRRAHR